MKRTHGRKTLYVEGVVRGVVGEYRRVIMTRDSCLIDSTIFVPPDVPLSFSFLIYYDHQDKVKRPNTVHRLYAKCRRKHSAVIAYSSFQRAPKKE